MKKIKLTLLALSFLSMNVAFSQEEFKKQWEVKVNVEPKWNAHNADLSLVMVGSLKELEMLDGATGKSLWTYNVKEKLGVKALEDWFFFVGDGR